MLDAEVHAFLNSSSHSFQHDHYVYNFDQLRVHDIQQSPRMVQTSRVSILSCSDLIKYSLFCAVLFCSIPFCSVSLSSVLFSFILVYLRFVLKKTCAYIQIHTLPLLQIHFHRDLHLRVTHKDCGSRFLYRWLHVSQRSLELAGLHGHLYGVSLGYLHHTPGWLFSNLAHTEYGTLTKKYSCVQCSPQIFRCLNVS